MPDPVLWFALLGDLIDEDWTLAVPMLVHSARVAELDHPKTPENEQESTT